MNNVCEEWLKHESLTVVVSTALGVEEGACCICGEPTRLAEGHQHLRAICDSPECSAAMKSLRQERGFHAFVRRVKKPHDLDWLARKLEIAADDPSLGARAFVMARRGQLVIFIRRDGTVGEVGWPRRWVEHRIGERNLNLPPQAVK